jgi:hypothetical protein
MKNTTYTADNYERYKSIKPNTIIENLAKNVNRCFKKKKLKSLVNRGKNA